MKIYIIRKMPYVDGWLMHYEYKKVSGTNLKKYQLQGWEIEREEYLIYSKIVKFWNALDRGTKTSIILAFVILFIEFFMAKI